MKTTFDIADNILARSRGLAKREHVSVKDLVEEGLLAVIQKHEAKPRHRVEPVTFKGNGLSTAFKGRGWQGIRDAAYEGHGS
jgi:hypothetical protein